MHTDQRHPNRDGQDQQDTHRRPASGPDRPDTRPDSDWGSSGRSALDSQAARAAQRYGVGARVSVHPMAEDFEGKILSALENVDTENLQVRTGDVSTWVQGAVVEIHRYLRDLLVTIADGGTHVGAAVLLSRGCPGEIEAAGSQCTTERFDPAALLPSRDFLDDPGLCGTRVRAQWSLYPMARGRERDHMDVVYDAIEGAKAAGVYAGSEHYVTVLEGDLAKVLATVIDAWITACAQVTHVVTHLNLSINSPSTAGRANEGDLR